MIPDWRGFLARTALALATGGAVAAAPEFHPSVPRAEAVARARDLVARMTLDEKITELHGGPDAEHRRWVPGIPRLGIPPMRITNGPAGAGPGDPRLQQPATALPAPIALAASWDTALAERYGEVAGAESRDLGNSLLESPDVNIARVPQGGRVFEAFGEDPFLASRMAVAEIEGIQSTGSMANVKHYVANDQETGRHSIDTLVAERPLREIYLPPFEAAVGEAHVASIMAAYPKVNGEFCCANRTLLRGVVDEEWGFDGFITSDFGAVHSTVPSALAGLDLELPRGIWFAQRLKEAVQSGAVPMAVIDEMLTRRFAKMIEFGWFDRPLATAPIPAHEDGAVSRSIAEQSMVLLKNEGGLLPLDAGQIRSVALLGDYALRATTGGGGSSHVVPLYTVAPSDGLKAVLRPATLIALADGSDVARAAAVAKAMDVAIVMVGLASSEGHDHGIELTPAENQLIAAVARANPRTVVVVKTGSAVLMPWIGSVPAVLEAWYPGEEDGHAVADVLFGRANPSGKLPLTFPLRVTDTLARNPEQYPGDGTTVRYLEGLDVGYRGYQAGGVSPLFPFGFGLSYTSFAFDDLKVAPGSGPSTATVSFRVTNTGARAGGEVAQLYLGFPPIAEGNEPPLQLKGFEKLFLDPGQSETVALRLDSRAFSYWSVRGHRWTVASGTFRVRVGDSSANLPLAADLAVP